jgi:hypothetical protein
MKILDNILPVTTNLSILEELAHIDWKFAMDRNESRFFRAFNNNTGFQNTTLYKGKPVKRHNVNLYAQIILDIVTDKLKMKATPYRFFWNLYFPNPDCYMHTDYDGEDEDKYYTIIYNLHTTDGGTEIDGVSYPDKMGQAKVFKSNTLHKAIPNITDKVRFNLNIIFKSDSEL